MSPVGLHGANSGIGKANVHPYNGSDGETFEGRPNSEWTLRDLPEDIQGNLMNHFPRDETQLEVFVSGTRQDFGTESDPRDIRWIPGTFGVKDKFIFEDGLQPGGGDTVSIKV